MTLYILNYNNYYNRIIKKENTFSDYASYIIYGPVQGVYGFTPGDGVNTTQVLGSNVQMYNGQGDYLLAITKEGEIDSRWFIIDTKRERNGQWTLTLHRDLVVDFYDQVIESPMFIEKATLAYNSPLLFNEENITVNQIKTNENLIKDKSGCPWLVGYYAKDATEMNGTIPTNNIKNAIQINLSTIEDWEFYQYNGTNPMVGPALTGHYLFDCAAGPALSPSYLNFSVNEKTGQATRKNITAKTVQLQYHGELPTAGQVTSAFQSFGMGNFDSQVYSNTASQQDVDDLLSFDGKLVQFLDGKYYTISVDSIPKEKTISIPSGSDFISLSNVVSNVGFSGKPNTITFKYKFTSNYFTVGYKEEVSLETTYNLNGAKLVTEDAPWNIFAIPYGEIVVKNAIGETLLNTNKDIGIATAMGIQAQKQSKVSDIQLLPYCPIQELITDDGEITVTDALQYSYIVDNSNQTNVGIIFNVLKSNFTFDITDVTIPQAQTAIEKKINNECDKWRLTSPNYSNYFDFSVEKNGGIQYFNVDCNYKPFTPYIHVNPNFSNLYGYDDNSPRGLILGGDFSLSQIIDQWEQYQIQNKNYQLTFDRQIQNMEIQQKYQRVGDIVGAVTGVGTGTAAGALAGSLIMPGIGTGIGAAVGGVASLAGGLADITINEQLRNEALDYTRDMFGYQLGNIQALPQTISKVSAFNENNKIFPVLEYYTCTPEEKQAFINKIAWNGMTVMRIGTMNEFIGNQWSYNGIESKDYIKGKLIRLEGTEDDYHIVNSLAGELNKGVYIK